MLFKWLFTLLVILWLIQAFRPFFQIQQGPGIRQTPPDNKAGKDADDEGEYIDYEEIE